MITYHDIHEEPKLKYKALIAYGLYLDEKKSHMVHVNYVLRAAKQFDDVANDRADLIIAMDGNEVVGICGSSVEGERGPLWVHPSYRGQGIGRELVSRVTSKGRAWFTTIEDTNLAAVCLAKSLGARKLNSYKGFTRYEVGMGE